MYRSRRLLALLNADRKRFRRVGTGFDSRCTQYLRNLVKSNSKKVITDLVLKDSKGVSDSQTGDGGNFTSAQAAGRMASVFAKLHSARSLACTTMEEFPIV